MSRRSNTKRFAPASWASRIAPSSFAALFSENDANLRWAVSVPGTRLQEADGTSSSARSTEKSRSSPEHGQLHQASLGSPDPLADLFEVLVLHALAVYGYQDVTGFDPRFLGGRAVHGRDDGDLLVLFLEFDPDPDVRAGDHLAVPLDPLGG